MCIDFTCNEESEPNYFIKTREAQIMTRNLGFNELMKQFGLHPIRVIYLQNLQTDQTSIVSALSIPSKIFLPTAASRAFISSVLSEIVGPSGLWIFIRLTFHISNPITLEVATMSSFSHRIVEISERFFARPNIGLVRSGLLTVTQQVCSFEFLRQH